MTNLIDHASMSNEQSLTINDWLRASSTADHLTRILARTASFEQSDPAWILHVPEAHIRAQWRTINAAKDAGCHMPLYGVPYAVKDNIDLAGLPTTAACPDFAYIAKEDAFVVKTLQKAGAVVVGKCNLDAFATGLVGTRSPYGAVPNTFDPRYVSGGSSSGSASVVARGLVPFALGTDTAGSGRVPAGFNNIIGLKATRGAISTRGVVPACRSLDCISIFTLTVEDSRLVFETCARYDTEDAWSRKVVTLSKASSLPRIATCDNPFWFGETLHADAYFNALEQTGVLGWRTTPLGFSDLFRLATLLYEGPWVAERYAAIQSFIERTDVVMDPIVRRIIDHAKSFNAVDVFEYEYLRKELTRSIEKQFHCFDAIIVPTTPTFPSLEDIRESPIKENSLLGTYTNFVNFLDWSAISIPAGFRADGLPFGLTIISKTWQEQKLFTFAEQYLSRGRRELGCTQSEHLEVKSNLPTSGESLQDLVIVGAHLRGFPLNYQLLEVNATFHQLTTTVNSYQLFELPSSNKIRKPGLRRVLSVEKGSSIEVEVWKVTDQALGSLMKLIPPPLAIGSVELEDGSWVKGFVCEAWGFEGARNITSFGGWKNYITSSTPPLAPDKQQQITSENSMAPITSILVANRGEIAVRIIKTLRKCGIRSIAIHSPEDSKAQHVRDADEAYLINGDSLGDTYLAAEAIIKIAKDAHADAIIPGYGFLSENADFAEACEMQDLIWIGPTPRQMRHLGLKHLAKDLARKAGVPLLSGTSIIDDIEAAICEASKIGYPVIIKSSAGGGGIGLQKCSDESSLRSTFDSTRHLSQTYFNDSRIFIEKYVINARHVEVQIIGDGNGVVKHVNERDCSLQRRNQKVIEESPAIFMPFAVRESMRQAAISVASSVNYRGVGTVEFIYDLDEKLFYFLEVNTRLQVEHCVTEESCGLDLVEAMIKIAANNASDLFDVEEFPVNRVAIEARIYGESPLQNFRPSPGQILNVKWPEGARIDTWITSGTVVPSTYDPLLAKIIVSGYDRPEAIRRLAEALDNTQIVGIETNLAYLSYIIHTEMFMNGTYITTSLDELKVNIPAFEVVEAGDFTTIQDFPARVGKWNAGIPPSGPLDSYSFRMANRLLENEEHAAGLEFSSGLVIIFHHDAYIAITGAFVDLHINDVRAEVGRPLKVVAGQNIRLDTLNSGKTAYISVKGGIQVPEIFGSRSTFMMGKIGGHCGRALRSGDIIPIHNNAAQAPREFKTVPPSIFGNKWHLRVLPGPHAFPDFLSKSSYNELFQSSWKVHHNSNRVGIRLLGPKPKWAREGGAAGLHPSNLHDSPYSIGSISFTGDQAVILGCDGPSLGGFMIFATTITADLWKLGQMRSGDEITLVSVTLNEARTANTVLKRSIVELTSLVEAKSSNSHCDPILVRQGEGEEQVMYRQAGDHAVLLEFGSEHFNVRKSAHIYSILQKQKKLQTHGVIDLTPGIRSLHVQYDDRSTQLDVLENLKNIINTLDQQGELSAIPSRIIHLPLAFEHASNCADIERYSQTIRSNAPWLPSNTDFLRRLNGLDATKDVETSVISSQFLVLGLGDVFFGSPCAIPLDPRHRLFGMKYNPSRSLTTEGSVGVGGQYLCIYAIDSPGGYQLVGRTVPIWNRFAKDGEQNWMFNMFDRIQFYSVSQRELDDAREKGFCDDLVKTEEALFDIDQYESWLADKEDDIEHVRRQKMKALQDCDALVESVSLDQDSALVKSEENESVEKGHVVIKAGIGGRCWKVFVEKGDTVSKGQTLFIVEAMKMEVKINATIDGICIDTLVRPGDVLDAETKMAYLKA